MLGRKNINGVSVPLFFRHRSIRLGMGRKLPETGQEKNSATLNYGMLHICLVEVERPKEFISE